MKFHLDYTPASPGFTINHKDKVLLIGSCFSENIGNFLKEHKFQVLSNPSGILFNPLSVWRCLMESIDDNPADENLIVERDGLFFSYLHHSSIHSSSREGLIEKINDLTKVTADFLRSCDYLMITFGSAFYYEHILSNTCVANCHKQPAGTFEKILASHYEIIAFYNGLLDELSKLNPKLKIVFTVSPVKYLKDGVVENARSKAALLSAIHEIISDHPNRFYFPAYELVTDDLRDYRFYKSDLAHPNEEAISYVWEKFSACFFDKKTKELNAEIHKLNQAVNHRQLQPDSSGTVKLMEYIEAQKTKIKSLNPTIEF